MPTLTLPDFVNKWRNSGLKERAGAQMHFLELCDVLGEPHPASEDFTGATYTFEKGGTTIEGTPGFADVWKRGCFAWEYKGKHEDLNLAYQQLLKYREDLENPPLLVVCDLERFEVHTNFTGTAKQIYRFSLDDLLKNQATAACKLPPIEVLRGVFTDPARLRPDHGTALTELTPFRIFASKVLYSLTQMCSSTRSLPNLPNAGNFSSLTPHYIVSTLKEGARAAL